MKISGPAEEAFLLNLMNHAETTLSLGTYIRTLNYCAKLRERGGETGGERERWRERRREREREKEIIEYF